MKQEKYYTKWLILYTKMKKNTFHKVFWTFRKVRQISHKKYANMSLKHRGQSIKSTKDVYFLRRDKMDCLYINRDKRTY